MTSKHTIGSQHPNLEVENASLMCVTPPPWYIVRTRFTQSNYKQQVCFLHCSWKLLSMLVRNTQRRLPNVLTRIDTFLNRYWIVIGILMDKSSAETDFSKTNLNLDRFCHSGKWIWDDNGILDFFILSSFREYEHNASHEQYLLQK